jgi:CheY-like chemotaxis protein
MTESYILIDPPVWGGFLVCAENAGLISSLTSRPMAKARSRSLKVLKAPNDPKRSGREVLSHIRRGPRCNRVPVVIVTSSEVPDDIEAARVLNATAYFVKPTDLSAYMELASAICQALPGRQKPA